MKTRIISFFLVMCVLLGLTTGAFAASSGYSDVPEDHWSAESVRRATELGLFKGVGDGKFGRGQPISRAAFTAALVRLFGWEEAKPQKDTFTDVTKERWFYGAVETAVQHGAVAAAGSAFRPTDNITREDMAAMLVRSLGYASLAGAVAAYGSPFTDVTVSRGFVTIAYDLGLMDGVGDGKFAPNATATREQAAAVLVRLYDKLNRKSETVSTLEGKKTIVVETPAAMEGAEMPTTPLEPMAALYGQLRELKNSGADMSEAVLSLTAGGVRTLVSKGKIVASDPISREEVEKILAGKDVRTYYSPRYESAYCIYQPNAYQTATLWYQSEKSMAAKLQLARLFDVTAYILT